MFRRSAIAYLGALTVLGLVGLAHTQGVVFELKQHDKASRIENIAKRGFNSDIVYDPLNLQFYIDASVGTPGQNINFTVGTGPWTWVPQSLPKNFCNNAVGNRSCGFGNSSRYFDRTQSSTFVELPLNFSAKYQDQSIAYGVYGTDQIQIAQTVISDIYLGVAQNWTTEPSLGIGVDPVSSDQPYDSFPVTMQKQGVINTVLYSIYLGDVRTRRGELVFGGVDIAKYSGDLKTVNTSDVGSITISAVSIVAEDNSTIPLSATGVSSTAILELGTPSLWVPALYIPDIVSALDAVFSSEYGVYSVPCDATFPRFKAIEFEFDDLKIDIGPEQFYVPSIDGTTCYLAIFNSTGKEWDFILGTPFMRAAYTVFDYTNRQTSFAPAIYNVTDTNIVEVGMNNGSVSSLISTTSTSSSSSSTSTSTSSSSSSTSTSSSSTTSSTVTHTPTITTVPAKKASHTGAIAGGAVGGVAAIALVGLGIFLFRRRRPMQPDMPPPTEGPPMDQQQNYQGVGAAGGHFAGHPNDGPGSPISPASPISELASPGYENGKYVQQPAIELPSQRY